MPPERRGGPARPRRDHEKASAPWSADRTPYPPPKRSDQPRLLRPPGHTSGYAQTVEGATFSRTIPASRPPSPRAHLVARHRGRRRAPSGPGIISPNFIGAEAAARHFAESPAWGAARAVKCTPDAAQLPVRVLADGRQGRLYYHGDATELRSKPSTASPLGPDHLTIATG